MRDRFRAAAEDRALVAVNALQIVEEFRRIQAPRDAKADAVRKRAVGFKKDAAVIVPNALSTLGLSGRCAGRASKKEKKQDAGDSGAPGTHEFDLAKNILLLARSGEKKRETAKCVKRFAVSIGLDRALAGANRLDRVGEPGKHVRLRDGNIVRSENQFQLRGERRQALYRIDVGVEIGLRAIEPDRSGIIHVARGKKTVGAVEQRDGVLRVARRGENFQGASAQVDLEAFVNKARNFPGLRGVRFWSKRFCEISGEL